MHIYLIRHADPGYNGHDDLTKQGHLEAASLAERLKAIGVNKIYSSDKVRAIKTAQYTADLVGVPISIEPGLMEPSQLVIMQNGKPYCIWDTYGETVRGGDIPTLYDWAERSPFDSKEMEITWGSFTSLADNLIASFGYKRENGLYRITRHSDDRIAIFTHNGTILFFLAYFLQIPLPLAFCGFYSWPSSVTDIYFDERSKEYAVPRTIYMADTSHLAVSGLRPQARGMGDLCPEFY